MAISLKSNSDGVTGSIQVNGTDAITFSASGVQTLREVSSALASGVIDTTVASVFTITATANTTFSVVNVPSSGTVCSFILEITNGGAYTITWWSGIDWASGIPPTLTAAGRDMLSFITYDGGTTWNGMFLGRDMK